MKTSQKGIDLIKKFEGCRLAAYKCPAGVWTIGYGHTKNVNKGQIITQEKAEELLKDDLIQYELGVMKYDTVYHWNQNQFDALVSFAYNVGSINQLTDNGTRSIEVIADKILLYNKAAGKELAGLTRRRKEEQALYLTPIAIKEPYKPGWNHDSNGWWYAYSTKEYYKSCWQVINCHKYYFNADGYAVTNWQEIDGKWYYFESGTGNELECALYVSDSDGVQSPGSF